MCGSAVKAAWRRRRPPEAGAVSPVVRRAASCGRRRRTGPPSRRSRGGAGGRRGPSRRREEGDTVSTASMGMLMLLSLATGAAGVVTVVLSLDDPPLSPSRLCAVLVPVFGSSAVAVYCYGWFSVAMGGPFPGRCEDRNASGAEWVGASRSTGPSAAPASTPTAPRWNTSPRRSTFSPVCRQVLPSSWPVPPQSCAGGPDRLPERPHDPGPSHAQAIPAVPTPWGRRRVPHGKA